MYFEIHKAAKIEIHHGASLTVPRGFRMPRVCRATLISILRRFLNSRQRWKAFHTGPSQEIHDPSASRQNSPGRFQVSQNNLKVTTFVAKCCCKVRVAVPRKYFTPHGANFRSFRRNVAERCSAVTRNFPIRFRFCSIKRERNLPDLSPSSKPVAAGSRATWFVDYLCLTKAHFLGRYSAG